MDNDKNARFFAQLTLKGPGGSVLLRVFSVSDGSEGAILEAEDELGRRYLLPSCLLPEEEYGRTALDELHAALSSF